MSKPSPNTDSDPARALFFQAVGAMQKGDAQTAIDMFRDVLKLNAVHAPSWNNLGTLLAGQGAEDEAIECFQNAIEHKEDFAEAYANLAQTLHGQGELEDALALFEHSLEVKPDDPTTHNRIGILYKNMQVNRLAEEHFRKAIALEPNYAEAYNNLAMLMWRLKRIDDAHENFEKALTLAPNMEEIYFSYAALLEFKDDMEAADALVEKAKKHVPDSLSTKLAEARLLRRKKDYKEALEVLKTVPDPNINIHYEYAYVYDKLEEPAQTFKHLEEAHKQTLETPEVKMFPESDYPAMLTNLRQTAPTFFKTQALDFDDTPVFLVGFPRSGTTLLDQILHAHPDITIGEEHPALETAIKTLPQYPMDFSSLGSDAIEQLRDTYFEKHREFESWKSGDLFIDENPLNIAHIGFAHALFPKAKIIFLQRHPYDVVLSCLFQKFQMSPAVRHMLSVENTARIYKQVMELWLHSIETLSLSVHTIRYEDLVDNLEDEMRALLTFLDLPWDEGVLDHTKTARQSYTASYAQVRENVHTRSKYRWRRYVTQLSPIFPLLSPLAETFGYDKD